MPIEKLKQVEKPKVVQKRPVNKMFIVWNETHRRLKEYAIKNGYKLEYVADEAVKEYLNRKEAK